MYQIFGIRYDGRQVDICTTSSDPSAVIRRSDLLPLDDRKQYRAFGYRTLDPS